MHLNHNPGRGVGQHAMYRHCLAMRRVLHQAFPRCFMGQQQPKLPLKIGIHLDLIPMVLTEHLKDLHNALSDYTNRTPFLEFSDGRVRIMTKEASYLRCLVEGAVRVDLNGDPAGVVSAEAAGYARDLIKKLEYHQAYAQRNQQNGGRLVIKTPPIHSYQGGVQ